MSSQGYILKRTQSYVRKNQTNRALEISLSCLKKVIYWLIGLPFKKPRKRKNEQLLFFEKKISRCKPSYDCRLELSSSTRNGFQRQAFISHHP